jgi:hypothetical protein
MRSDLLLKVAGDWWDEAWLKGVWSVMILRLWLWEGQSERNQSGREGDGVTAKEGVRMGGRME